MVIGTDTPWMGAERVGRAFAELKAKDVVIGPAEDGDYYLLGMRKMVAGIFREIPWCTERVLELTLEVIASEKLRKKLLRRDFDLDRPEDLWRAERMLKRRPQLTPALAAAIREVKRLAPQKRSEAKRRTSEGGRDKGELLDPAAC